MHKDSLCPPLRLTSQGLGTHLVVEYAGMFAGHVVAVTIARKAHIHVSSCPQGTQNMGSVQFRKAGTGSTEQEPELNLKGQKDRGATAFASDPRTA